LVHVIRIYHDAGQQNNTFTFHTLFTSSSNNLSIPFTSLTQSLVKLLSKNYNLWFNYSVLYFTSNLLTTRNYLFTLTNSLFVLLFTLHSHPFYCKLHTALIILPTSLFTPNKILFALQSTLVKLQFSEWRFAPL